jgi:NTP pyrophosphatase (non-canonical NTP hydrolase)
MPRTTGRAISGLSPGELTERDNRNVIERFNEYQILAHRTANYNPEQWLEYLALGLAGEAGELAGKVSKVFRGDKEADHKAWAYELGDVLWFVSEMADMMGYDLEEIATMNYEKLKSRDERGVIKGDGDNR